jgi:hypothetical protein
MTTDFRALCAELAYELDLQSRFLLGKYDDWITHPLANRARAALAQSAQPAPSLAARAMLERVARLGDCIDANTVGEISTISASAAAWLRDNPPGQPVAIEPRGCPTPGACSCVEPADLLERLAETVPELPAITPIPVSERLPGSKDCDDKGRVWAWCHFDSENDGNGDFWALVPSKWLNMNRSCWVYWFPSSALAEPSLHRPRLVADDR